METADKCQNNSFASIIFQVFFWGQRICERLSLVPFFAPMLDSNASGASLHVSNLKSLVALRCVVPCRLLSTN